MAMAHGQLWSDAADMTTEDAIRERLRDHLKTIDPQGAPTRDDGLIRLLGVSKLLEQVWAPHEFDALHPHIFERTKRARSDLQVKEAVQNVRPAIVAGPVVSIS
jgi:hypothetical protein